MSATINISIDETTTGGYRKRQEAWKSGLHKFHYAKQSESY